MKWRANLARSIAVSDCGRYEVRLSTDRHRGDFYNAWFLPTNKHIEASHKKKIVVAACIAHAAKLGAKAVSA